MEFFIGDPSFQDPFPTLIFVCFGSFCSFQHLIFFVVSKLFKSEIKGQRIEFLRVNYC